MSNPVDNPPAFPNSSTQDGHANNVPQGMSLRDYFAAAALQGLVASNFYDRCKLGQHTVPCAAAIAYEYADRMLEFRAIKETSK